MALPPLFATSRVGLDYVITLFVLHGCSTASSLIRPNRKAKLMATYVVSFRIGQDSEYAQRWKSVVEAIHNQADDGTCWEETTSLIIFRSSKSAEQIALDV